MIVKVVGRNRWIRGLVWLGWIGFMLLIIKDIIRSREVESTALPGVEANDRRHVGSGFADAAYSWARPLLTDLPTPTA